MPALVGGWNDQNYKVVVCGRDIRCVVLGESHDNKQYIAKQAELIELVRPELVLHEFGAAHIYDPQARRYCWQPQRKADHGPVKGFPTPLIEQADRLGHKIVGIDLTFIELHIAHCRLAHVQPDKFKWVQVGKSLFHGYLVKRSNPSYEFTHLDPVTLRLRDAQMVKEIGLYEKQSKLPIIVIVGDHHAGNFHNRKLLREHGFGYIIVHQTRVVKSESVGS